MTALRQYRVRSSANGYAEITEKVDRNQKLRVLGVSVVNDFRRSVISERNRRICGCLKEVHP